MNRIQLLIVAGLVLFITNVGAQQQVSFAEEKKAEARQQVSLSEMKSGAVSALKMKTGEALIDEQAIDTVFTLNSEKNNTLLYECKFRGGKTVLMSGSKACIPVLGYFDSPPDVFVLDPDADIPDALRSILYEYQEQIKLYFAADDTIQLHKEAEWQGLQDNTISKARAATPPGNIIVAPLITTKWDQDYSYNGAANAYNYHVTESTASCGKCPAGCVAVAMAQIMNYWKYPVYVKGDPTRPFDWCNMVDSLDSRSPNYIAERNAVATLIRTCGLKVGMKYCRNNACESGASAEDARDAFKNHFYYHSGIDFSNKSNFTAARWKERTKEELRKGQPVYYRGESSAGGHGFVCDGYDSQDYFHFNWGWGGSWQNDAWLTLDDLTPGGHNFKSKQASIIGIRPKDTCLQPNGTYAYCDNTISLSDYYANYYSGGVAGDFLSSTYAYANTPTLPAHLISATTGNPTTWCTIPSGATSTYVAHKSITLRPGFHAQAGSTFTARIHLHPCSQNQVPWARSVVMDGNFDENYYDEEVLDVEKTIAPNTQARLYQNTPNPFTGETVIGYYVPDTAHSAYLRFMTATGAVAKAISLSSFGKGEVNISANELSPGVYFYTLVVDGQIVNSRQMIVGN